MNAARNLELEVTLFGGLDIETSVNQLLEELGMTQTPTPPTKPTTETKEPDLTVVPKAKEPEPEPIPETKVIIADPVTVQWALYEKFTVKEPVNRKAKAKVKAKLRQIDAAMNNPELSYSKQLDEILHAVNQLDGIFRRFNVTSEGVLRLVIMNAHAGITDEVLDKRCVLCFDDMLTNQDQSTKDNPFLLACYAIHFVAELKKNASFIAAKGD